MVKWFGKSINTWKVIGNCSVLFFWLMGYISANDTTKHICTANFGRCWESLPSLWHIVLGLQPQGDIWNLIAFSKHLWGLTGIGIQLRSRNSNAHNQSCIQYSDLTTQLPVVPRHKIQLPLTVSVSVSVPVLCINYKQAVTLVTDLSHFTGIT